MGPNLAIAIIEYIHTSQYFTTSEFAIFLLNQSEVHLDLDYLARANGVWAHFNPGNHTGRRSDLKKKRIKNLPV